MSTILFTCFCNVVDEIDITYTRSSVTSRRVGTVMTVKPGLSINNTSDRTRNVLRVLVGTGDGYSKVIVGSGRLCWFL